MYAKMPSYILIGHERRNTQDEHADWRRRSGGVCVVLLYMNIGEKAYRKTSTHLVLALEKLRPHRP